MSLSVSLASPTPVEWQSLRAVQVAQYAFMSRSWYAAWSAHLLERGSWRGPHSCAVVRNSRREVIGVFPYAWQRIGPLKFLSLGGPYGPLRSIPIAATDVEAACGALADFFSARSNGVGLRLGPVEDTDVTVSTLLRRLGSLGWRLYPIRESTGFVLHTPSSLEAYGELIGTARIRRAAYRQRRMARRGHVDIQLHSGLDVAGWTRVMADVEAIELGSWVAREGGLLRFSGPENRSFWAEFLADPGASQATRVWLLFFDGRAVSHGVAIDSGPVRYIITNAYLEAVKNFSAGVIVVAEMVQDAIRRGLRIINYGEGDAGYKSEWGFGPERRMQDWLALPPGVRSAVLEAGLRALTAFSRLTAGSL